MPGIKSPRFKLNRLGLALAAALCGHPALADEEPVAGAPAAVEHDQAAPVPVLWWHSDLPEAPADADAASTSDVWQRIRNGFGIGEDASENPLVAVHQSWFLARPENLRRLAERSRPYLYHIVEELDRRAMPMEIALLPMIESAFNPTAQSPAAASGIWQFIPSTGRHYGLRQDNWYDGRRDFAAATNAALDYLGKLFLDFGDWQLALAAYNCGEGCVARAIQNNVMQGRPTDYASLSLPSETRHYVPKLLALKTLLREPETYGIAIEALPDQPYFNQVTVHASMDIQSAARLADMSSDEFAALNAAFPRKLIRSDTPVSLLVPVDKADTFQRNLDAGEWDTWRPYPARRGERPAAIAQHFNVSLTRLAEHNQLDTKNGRLVRAQTILVPVRGRNTRVVQNAMLDPIPEPSVHVVQRGETLSGLARHYGFSVAALKRANPEVGTRIKVGQSIRLPAGAAPGAEAAIVPAAFTSPKAAPSHKAASTHRYTVRRGDTLHAIAQRFAMSLAELKQLNPEYRKRSTIRVGQSVVVGKP